MANALTQKLIEAIRIENRRGETLHGPMTKDHARALVILVEEVGEVATAILEMTRKTGYESASSASSVSFRAAAMEELVQVVSVAVRIIRNLDVEGVYHDK